MKFDLHGRNWGALVVDQNSAGRPDVPLVQGEQVLSGGGGRVLDGAVRVFQRAELVLALDIPNDKVPRGKLLWFKNQKVTKLSQYDYFCLSSSLCCAIRVKTVESMCSHLKIICLQFKSFFNLI
jgi:hypothetical protein